MKYLDLINDENCNIFTDTSFKHEIVLLNGEEYDCNVVSPGANIYDPNTILLDSLVSIIPNSSVPQGEIMGILYGLELGYKHVKPGQVINIFSDSKISIMGVRDWIFRWINKQRNGFLYGYNRLLICNQIYFLGIVYTILRHNIPVRFYYVRGHMNYKDHKDRRIFYNSFVHENNIKCQVSDIFITYLMKGNDKIDNTVKTVLTSDNIQRSAKIWYNNPMSMTPLEMIGVCNTPEFIKSLDMNKYRQLIGGK